MPTGPDRATWVARLDDALADSVEAASRAMTNEPSIQGWLRTASFSAAMNLQGAGHLDAAAAAYGQMLDDLHERFPALIEAVREVTAGTGGVDLNWRPLSPQFSTLILTFAHDGIDHLLRLDQVTDGAIADALARLSDRLPKGHPFPNRPHRLAGLLAHEGQGVRVRVEEHAASNDGRTQRFLVKGPGAEEQGPMPRADAVQAVRACFDD